MNIVVVLKVYDISTLSAIVNGPDPAADPEQHVVVKKSNVVGIHIDNRSGHPVGRQATV